MKSPIRYAKAVAPSNAPKHSLKMALVNTAYRAPENKADQKGGSDKTSSHKNTIKKE